MNIPIFLTLLRILVIPVIVLAYYAPFAFNHWFCAVLFAMASLTDWLDGYLARTWGQTSALGRFLDPLADKLIIATCLVLLVAQPFLPYIMLPAAIIVAREITISALREWMAEIGKRTSVAVSYIAKVKTTLQMLAVLCLLTYSPGDNLIIVSAGYLLLYVASLLTVWTMCAYLRTAWPDLRLPLT